MTEVKFQFQLRRIDVSPNGGILFDGLRSARGVTNQHGLLRSLGRSAGSCQGAPFKRVHGAGEAVFGGRAEISVQSGVFRA